MNYSAIIRATPALAEIKKMRLPYSVARDVHKMHKTLEAEFKFFAEEETKLIKQYAAKTEKGTPNVNAEGRIFFDDMEARNAFQVRFSELQNTDAKISTQTITITAADIGKQLISPETIEALEGFIVFE